jgi:hypothetical protein
MVVPSREFGDFLVADWAETRLFFPQAKQLPSPLEVIDHFHAEVFLKVEFPGRVIGVGFAFDFDPPGDRCGTPPGSVRQFEIEVQGLDKRA